MIHRSIALAAAVLPLLPACRTEPKGDDLRAAHTRPNILVLLADDMGWADLTCYGSRNTSTPHLDRLAAQGVRFTDFYAGAPLCSPSRAALLTGRSPNRAGIYSYIPPDGPHYLRASEVTIAELLRDAGYETMHAGKWHLCHDLLSEGLPQARDHGFQYSFATENNASPSHRDPVNFVRNGEEVGPLEGYSAQLVADEVIDWLTVTRDRSRPFLACAWFHETHTPIASPPELVGRHAEAEEQDAAYYANVESLDAAAGRLLATLEQLGLAEETLVVFSSDNGGLREESNGGLRGRKSFLWEGGIRVPGVIRWPGHIEPATVMSEPAGLVDLLPTLCAATKVAPPGGLHLDGVDLTPLFAGEVLQRETPLFWCFYRTVPAAAMRVGDWVILGMPETKVPFSHRLTADQQDWLSVTKLRRFQLFDLGTDPAQTTDLAVTEPERLARMRAQLVGLYDEVYAEGPRWVFGD